MSGPADILYVCIGPTEVSFVSSAKAVPVLILLCISWNPRKPCKNSYWNASSDVLIGQWSECSYFGLGYRAKWAHQIWGKIIVNNLSIFAKQPFFEKEKQPEKNFLAKAQTRKNQHWSYLILWRLALTKVKRTKFVFARLKSQLFDKIYGRIKATLRTKANLDEENVRINISARTDLTHHILFNNNNTTCLDKKRFHSKRKAYDE